MVRKEIKDFVRQSEQNASRHKQRSRMPICISGLTHTHHSYIHFSRVLGTGGTQRQSTWTVPHGKDTQHGNESTWQLKQGRRSAAGKESGRSSSGQLHSLDWSKHYHRQDTQLYRKDERPTMRGGNQVGEVRRAPSEES